MTHYEILNVSEKASATVIRSTYRLLMNAFHPDRLVGSADEETRDQNMELVKAINEAYSVLSHPGRRARYDAQLASARAIVYHPRMQYYMSR